MVFLPPHPSSASPTTTDTIATTDTTTTTTTTTTMLAPSTTWPSTTTTTTWTSPTTTWTSPTTTTTLPTTTDPPTTTTTTTTARVTTSPPPPPTTQNPTTQPPVRTTTTLTIPFTSLIGSPPTSLIPTSTDLSVVPTSTNGTSDGTGGGIPKVAIIGIAVAGVVIIGVVSIVLVMKNQRHKRRQKELDPNELFGPNTLTNITSGHHQSKHHQHPDDNQYPEDHYDDGGTHQHEMEQLYHNTDYHHQNHHGHHDGGHHGHHGGDHNGYDHGGGHDSGTNQAPGHYDPSSGGHQAIGNDGATGNQYAPNGGHGGGGDFQGVGHGAGDTGNYNYGVGQGQSVGGADQGHHLYDGYGGGHDTGYGHGSSGNDFGGYGQGHVDPSSGYGGNGVSGGGSNIGVAGTGTGGIGGGGGGGIGVGGSQPITSIPSGLQGGYAPYSIGAIPPPVPFIPNRNSSNQIPVNPANTTAQQESYLLDLTSIPAPQGTSSTSYRPLDRFSSNASRSTHYSGGTGGGSSPASPPPIPIRPGSSTITHSTWDNSTQEFRSDRPLSQASMASSTTAGAYHQSIGSPNMYQDFIPPPTTNRVLSPKIASVLPATTASSTAGVRRSVGAPQDRGPDLPSASGGQASDLNAFERRAPQTQEDAQNPDSLFNVVASTLRQPQGGP